ncbi:SDR family NAD(P)-dependent oxidoreductase [Streptomyces sp. NPDC020801]|uniref:SDR family NAD(P)-dependent oxidoreductase n=1 Tax=unclassified Streptomyces TaxID=2593676 RepID=UPI0037AA832E
MPQTLGRSSVWFVTGASRGLGRAVVEAALTAGDRVIGAARDVTPLADLAKASRGRLMVLPLDVRDRAAVFTTVDRAAEAFGALDIVVNNAGRMLFGMVEETAEAQARDHLDTNFFGALWVTQAVLPHLRKRGGGHLLQVTAANAGSGAAAFALYGAGKAALNAMSQALADEVAPFGITVTVLEPGGYDTELFDRGTTTTKDPAYAAVRTALYEQWSQATAPPPAPEAAAAAVLTLVREPHPPRRLTLNGPPPEQAEGNLSTGDDNPPGGRN